MRLAFAGSPEAALPTLDWIAQSEHQLVRVFSQPDRPSGRGKKVLPTPVSQWAEENQYPIVKAERALELAQYLEDIDCVVTVGYGILLPEEILEIPTHGFINLHFSLLPHWRGAAPVQRAIANQDTVSGVTVFLLDSGMDTGPIYTSARFALDSDITSDELLHELSLIGPEQIDIALSMIERGVAPKAQSQSQASLAPKLSRQEGRVNWNSDAATISAHIRAFTSNPGAWTTLRGQVIKIESPEIADFSLEPGLIEVRDRALFVGTATSALSIATCIPQGKSRMAARDWINGARLTVGEKFE